MPSNASKFMGISSSNARTSSLMSMMSRPRKPGVGADEGGPLVGGSCSDLVVGGVLRWLGIVTEGSVRLGSGGMAVCFGGGGGCC